MASDKKFDVVVVGIGAMGGGMARALLESDIASTVVGFDLNEQAVAEFHEEATKLGKSSGEKPSTILKDVISQLLLDNTSQQQPDQEGMTASGTNHHRRPFVVVLSLVNEAQCNSVCFDKEAANGCLLDLLPSDQKSCVIMTSTVTSTFAVKADQQFRDKGIYFVDCPVSGGPVRSRNGDLSLFASGSQDSIEYCRPVLEAMAREGDLHVIEGGAGKGSTVKTVHQLLAGVHIAAAAEAMAMGEKAGLDLEQLYRIVNGAAGASWMFTDRGKRMLPSESEEGGPEVKSALNIFIKDLGIVSGEAQRLDCNTPLATAALAQFKEGEDLGFGRQDDSQVIKVYKRQKHNHDK